MKTRYVIDYKLIGKYYIKFAFENSFRFEITGITEDNLVDGMPLLEVSKKIEKILYNGESVSRARLEGGKARVLVGHDLDHDLDCLKMYYPPHLIR